MHVSTLLSLTTKTSIEFDLKKELDLFLFQADIKRKKKKKEAANIQVKRVAHSYITFIILQKVMEYKPSLHEAKMQFGYKICTGNIILRKWRIFGSYGTRTTFRIADNIL